jgi:ribosome-associated protein
MKEDEPARREALHGPEDARDLAVSSLEDDKLEDIVAIDLRGKTQMADFMVVASGRSSRQVVAAAEKLVERCKAALSTPPRVEGRETGDWVLIDCGDVIVHIFRPEVRAFYQLEKMWASPSQAPVSPPA